MSINLNKETKIVNGKYIYIDDAKKDYIQDISIDTNIKQDSREGYNLLDVSDISDFSSQWVKITNNNDGSLTINGDGTDVTKGTFYKLKNLPSLKAGNYVFSLNANKTLATADYYLDIRETKSDSSMITIMDGTLNFGSEFKSFTISEDKENLSLIIWAQKGLKIDNLIIYPMLIEGTENKPYEQYGSMPSIEFPSEIKTPVGKQELYVGNKNLLPFNLVTQDVNGTILTINEDKSFTIKGTTIGGLVSKSLEIGRVSLKSILDIPVTLSRGFINRDNNIGAFVSKLVDSNGNVILTNALNIDANSWTQHASKTFASSEWGSYDDLDLVVILFFPSLDGAKIDLEGYAQLEYGTVATDYTPHQSQVQDLDVGELLGPIVDKEDGSYFENRYGKYIFTGDETIGLSNNNSCFTYISNFVKRNTNESEIAPILCNFLTPTTWYKRNYTESEKETISTYSKSIGFYKFGLETVDEFKAKLTELYNNETPLEVLYELETPTYTKLTEEQQAQWNKIKKMHTYEGVTNLYTINENGISPVINLEYTTKYAEEYDFYIDENARFIVPEYDINYQVSIPESDLSDMPEASESAVKIAGKDGDVVLNTTYEPKDFNIVAYTDDNLDPKDKEAEKTKLVNFLHSIKNRTKNFGLLYREKFYPVKYNDKLTPTIYPKSIRFEIPIKSSKSLGYALEKKMIFGNGKEISNTIEETGCKIIIEGPIYGTNDSPMVITLNDYQMAYYNTVLEGNRLEIDTNNSTIKHISSNGEVTNVAAYYNHEYPKIKYGENEIKILSKIDSETQVYTEWYDLKI